MKKKTILLVLMMLIGVIAVSAVEISPGWTYGAELGITRGNNAGSRENLAPMARGFLQLEIFKFLYMRTGLGYTPLHASKTYATNTFMGDTRFIFSPLHDKKYAPYLFAGAGASLDMAKGNSDVVPLFPFGLGVELDLKKGMDLEVAATYFHSNSDQLDRLTLYDQDTTEKNDGFWGLTAGLTFSDPGPQRKAQPKPVVVEEELEPVPEPVVVTFVVEKPAPVDTRTKDSDQDGLSDYDEANVYMTDPLKADTDGDGLNDGVEIKTHKTDPLRADSDNDGLADGAELLTHKTDPLRADTDGDGLIDRSEILDSKTDPLIPDTDGDGMMDGAEVQIHKTDPLKSDTDGDGLYDGIEINQIKIDALNPDTDGDSLNDALEVNQYKTDPIKADTDGDGLNDGAEVLNHKTDPLKMDTDADGLNDFDEAVQYKTDPLKVDTDSDTLSDYAEVMQHKTNPLVMDTDKGTVDDGTEVAENKDPLDPKDDVLDLRVGSTFSLEGIFFETAKSNILPESIPKLEQAFAALTANPDVKILIVGHTDSDGSEASNLTLSKNRADAVKKWLVDKGIATDRIRTDGKGESQPKATNDTAEGKALNRRIEFVVE